MKNNKTFCYEIALVVLFLVFFLFGCSGNVKETNNISHEEIEEELIAENKDPIVDNVYPIKLNDEEIHDWIELFHGEWIYGDRSASCSAGSNAIIIGIGHEDPNDLESAYNISQHTACCNDGISYNINSIEQIDEETFEVHLKEYTIIMPEDAGRSYQNYTLLPTDTYIIRNGNDEKTFFMQFKGLNKDNYQSFSDGKYMSNYEELYLGEDEWYEFKLFWKDGSKVD